MTDRKKWGIGMLVTGILGVLGGVVVLATNLELAYLAVVLSALGEFLQVFGFTRVYPGDPPPQG